MILEGNKRLKEDKITKEIRLKPRQVFTRSAVRQDVARIVELYRRQGRFAASVEPRFPLQAGDAVILGDTICWVREVGAAQVLVEDGVGATHLVDRGDVAGAVPMAAHEQPHCQMFLDISLEALWTEARARWSRDAVVLGETAKARWNRG